MKTGSGHNGAALAVARGVILGYERHYRARNQARRTAHHRTPSLVTSPVHRSGRAAARMYVSSVAVISGSDH